MLGVSDIDSLKAMSEFRSGALQFMQEGKTGTQEGRGWFLDFLTRHPEIQATDQGKALMQMWNQSTLTFDANQERDKAFRIRSHSIGGNHSKRQPAPRRLHGRCLNWVRRLILGKV